MDNVQKLYGLLMYFCQRRLGRVCKNMSLHGTDLLRALEFNRTQGGLFLTG
jgi:hypothetical protein